VSAKRPQRVAEQIREVLGRGMRELRDPRVGFVTLTDVIVSPDLKHARVFVSTMQADPQPVLAGLRRAVPFLKRTLAREASLRFVPELSFRLDESVAGGFAVERILDDLRAGHEPDRDPDPDEDEDAGPA
jgi:ribosome-binding factor A